MRWLACALTLIVALLIGACTSHCKYKNHSLDLENLRGRVKMVAEDGDGWSIVTEYDEYGNKLSTTVDSELGIPIITQYIYDEEGRRINVLDGESTTKYEARYNEQYHLVHETFERRGTIHFHAYTYDDDHRIVTVQEGDNEVVNLITNYTYNNEGIISTIEYFFPAVNNQSICQCDAWGNSIRTVTHADGAEVVIENHYEYDKYGNWISTTMSEQGQELMRRTRVIEYW